MSNQSNWIQPSLFDDPADSPSPEKQSRTGGSQKTPQDVASWRQWPAALRNMQLAPKHVSLLEDRLEAMLSQDVRLDGRLLAESELLDMVYLFQRFLLPEAYAEPAEKPVYPPPTTTEADGRQRQPWADCFVSLAGAMKATNVDDDE